MIERSEIERAILALNDASDLKSERMRWEHGEKFRPAGLLRPVSVAAVRKRLSDPDLHVYEFSVAHWTPEEEWWWSVLIHGAGASALRYMFKTSKPPSHYVP